jgi:hypothetical protein
VIQNNLKKIKNLEIKINEPFHELSLNFLNSFSLELKKNKSVYKSPELFYLMLFCSKKNILKLKKNYLSNQFRIGRGLVFHVCPNNVPTNFVFSFIFGLLSGNTNIVKLPSKKSREKDLIVSSIKKVLLKKKFNEIKKSNIFLEYDYKLENSLTKLISSKSDARVIWGGDKTIKSIKEFETQPRCVDVNFSDRYSLSVIEAKKINNLTKTQINILARKFFYDVFTMNQMACNSPHFLFWSGQLNPILEKYFWNKVCSISKEKFKFDNMHVISKYNNLVNKLMNNNFIEKINLYKNFLYVINVNKKITNIEEVRGENGTIFQVKINNLNDLSKFIKKKCQTITYYGFKKREFENLIKKNNLLGADRIVEIGQAFEFDLNWDGFDAIKTLTRVVNFK